MVWLKFITPWSVALVILNSSAILLSHSAQSSEIDGFTEPFRTIDIAASETGILERVLVSEGSFVKRGDEVASLTTDVLQAALDVAERSMNAQGQLNSVKAELKLKAEMLKKIEGLRQKNHASQEEFDRISVEKEIAEARVLAVWEELQVRRLEHRRIGVQIERRRLRSPIDGTVMRVWKDEAEFVAPNEPIVVTVVQLDPLLAVFSVPSASMSYVKRDPFAKLKIGEQPVDGTVETISPVNDAQSGTVLVKIRVVNHEGKFRSGERCKLLLNDGPPKLTESRGKTIRK